MVCTGIQSLSLRELKHEFSFQTSAFLMRLRLTIYSEQILFLEDRAQFGIDDFVDATTKSETDV